MCMRHQLPTLAHRLSLNPRRSISSCENQKLIGCVVSTPFCRRNNTGFSVPFHIGRGLSSRVEKMHSLHGCCKHKTTSGGDPRASKGLPPSLLVLDHHKAVPTTHVVPATSYKRVEFPSQLHFVVPPVSLQAVSRPFELSLQSSLQLSLTVLVCYRYCYRI